MGLGFRVGVGVGVRVRARARVRRPTIGLAAGTPVLVGIPGEG